MQLDRTTEIIYLIFLQHLSRCFDYAIWPWDLLTLCQYNQDYTNTKTALWRECFLEVNEFVQFFIFFFLQHVKPFLDFPIHFYFTELFFTRSILLHMSSAEKIWFIDQLLFCVPIKFAHVAPTTVNILLWSSFLPYPVLSHQICWFKFCQECLILPSIFQSITNFATCIFSCCQFHFVLIFSWQV